ncbi:MAG: hypothetical protein QXJ99_03740, partial [Thermofilum sp.]
MTILHDRQLRGRCIIYEKSLFVHRDSFSIVDDEQRKNLLNKWLIVVFRANSTAPVEKEGLFKPPFLPEPFNRSTCIM